MLGSEECARHADHVRMRRLGPNSVGGKGKCQRAEKREKGVMVAWFGWFGMGWNFSTMIGTEVKFLGRKKGERANRSNRASKARG